VPERPTLRGGFTTGSAASASAKAAALALLGLLPAQRPCPVDIPLPDGSRLTVPVAEVADLPPTPGTQDMPGTPGTGTVPAAGRLVRAVTVKDAGDAPDVTQQARIARTGGYHAARTPREGRTAGGA